MRLSRQLGWGGFITFIDPKFYVVVHSICFPVLVTLPP